SDQQYRRAAGRHPARRAASLPDWPNSQLLQVNALGKVVIAYRNGAPVRVNDVGRVVDGSDAPLQLDWVDNHIGEMIGIWRQPGSNTLQLVNRVKTMLPRLRAGIASAPRRRGGRRAGG